MKRETLIALLFYVAALYDGVLGLAFLFAAPSVFEWYAATPPNHYGYVQFPAALLIVFAILFFNVARDQVKNRNLILYGILLKVSYCGVVFYYWTTSTIPNMWKPFAIFDLAFVILFVLVYRTLKSIQAK